MISEDDFNFISRFDSPDHQVREGVIRENPSQLAKTFYGLLSQVNKLKKFFEASNKTSQI